MPIKEVPVSQIPRFEMSKCDLTPGEIINRLGGTCSVSRIFGIKPPSVSEWRENGIPKTAMMYIHLAYPDVISGKVRYISNRRKRKDSE